MSGLSGEMVNKGLCFKVTSVIRDLFCVIGDSGDGGDGVVCIVLLLSVQRSKSILTPVIVKDCAAERLRGGDVCIKVTVGRTSDVM